MVSPLAGINIILYIYLLIFFYTYFLTAQTFFLIFGFTSRRCQKKFLTKYNYPPSYPIFVHSQTNISLHNSLPFLTTISLDLFLCRPYNSFQQLSNGERNKPPIV
nr:MAG TPA: hypothetical protein [Caudoviricetes sp.]